MYSVIQLALRRNRAVEEIVRATYREEKSMSTTREKRVDVGNTVAVSCDSRLLSRRCQEKCRKELEDGDDDDGRHKR